MRPLVMTMDLIAAISPGDGQHLRQVPVESIFRPFVMYGIHEVSSIKCYGLRVFCVDVQALASTRLSLLEPSPAMALHRLRKGFPCDDSIFSPIQL